MMKKKQTTTTTTTTKAYATSTFPLMYLFAPHQCCISIVFNFPWEGEMKNKGCAKFGGGGGQIKVHYGKRGSGVLSFLPCR